MLQTAVSQPRVLVTSGCVSGLVLPLPNLKTAPKQTDETPVTPCVPDFK